MGVKYSQTKVPFNSYRLYFPKSTLSMNLDESMDTSIEINLFKVNYVYCFGAGSLFMKS